MTEKDRSELDLSRWSVAYVGAPVREATLRRFADAFANCGFRRESIYPCYGLAEATLKVTGGRPQRQPILYSVDGEALEQGRAVPTEEGRAQTLVGCGQPRGTMMRVAIVDTGVADRRPRPAIGSE